MERSRISSHSPRWIWIASIWLGFGLVDAMQTVFVMRSEGMHHAWGRLFLTSLLSWLPWALATPLIMRLGRRFPLVKRGSMVTWVAHVAGLAAIALASAAWLAWLDFVLNPFAYASGPGRFGRLLFDKFYSGVLSSLLLYAGILAVQYLLDFGARLAYQQTETARLNEQLAKAQLDALRRQIEPHFLFNTLNAVTGLVREGRSETAVSMIAELSDFMRRVLEDSTRQEVPLGQEMEFAQKYLEIQKVRFVERLQLSVEVPTELLLAQVPTLILQPMVENAIKHGIAKRAQGGAVRISASLCDSTLTLAVYNDGPGLPESWETSHREGQSHSGIGISNMRTRLRSLYGDAFKLKLENQAPGGVEVSVSVPFKE
jgi:glucose-6-phosphate-specific signal transduction histidine kinase